MRLLLLLFLFLGLITTAPAGTVQTVTHHSSALEKDQSYQIYLPRDAGPDRRYPVLYVLHGAWGSYKDWTTNTNVEELADNYRMILVFPDGGEFGWYVDSPIEPKSAYATYITKELIEEVDSRYPTIPQREARAIMGLSMGGHGALSLAARYPELYTSASSLSGIVDLTRHPDKWQIAQRLGPLSQNRSAWEANSVLQLADRFKDNGVRILFDCGVKDTATGATQDNVALHARLKELGVPHVYRSLPGGHTWEYWQDNLKSHLNFHQASVLGATPNLERWFGFYHARMDGFLKENALRTLEDDWETTATLPVNRDAATTITLALVGSSSAHGMSQALFPGFRLFNRGISADRIGITSRGISHRMEESFFDMKPQVVVLKIGRNDLSAAQSNNGDPSLDRIVEEYDKVVRTVRERMPDSLFIVTSSFPVRDSYARLKDPIEAWNKRLPEIAAKNGALYLDVHTELKGEDGLLKPEYSGDGLHLSAAGKKLWADRIMELVRNTGSSAQ